jgi:hypothetical protein
MCWKGYILVMVFVKSRLHDKMRNDKVTENDGLGREWE